MWYYLLTNKKCKTYDITTVNKGIIIQTYKNLFIIGFLNVQFTPSFKQLIPKKLKLVNCAYGVGKPKIDAVIAKDDVMREIIDAEGSPIGTISFDKLFIISFPMKNPPAPNKKLVIIITMKTFMEKALVIGATIFPTLLAPIPKAV